jgi:simple sugar transport system ATP-binding protein
LLKATAITRRFSRVVALDGVDFAANPGEIHALLGENGAGKTTLMNVLSGRLRPDAGVATLDGVELRLGSPALALKAGIAAVHQSPMLFERMTWEENLAVGGIGADSRARLDLDRVGESARELAKRLGFELPPPRATVEGRSMGERVRLEIIRALSLDPRVLILDEPTGVLAPGELFAFLELLRRLRSEGRIVILITHKLGEALGVADRITVLRRGRVVAVTEPASTSESELARLMIGELPERPDAACARHEAAGETLLRISDLSLEYRRNRVLDGITMSLAAGEIVGIAGVEGNGQAELVEVLAGARRATSGSVAAGASDRARPDSAAVAVLPQNRDIDGLVLDMSLWENLLLARAIRSRMARRGWLDRDRAAELCRELIRAFRIRAEGPGALAASLSGGNRQRLSVARALAQNPRVLIAHDVCRGLDLAATAEVYRTLLDFRADGGAVLLVSSDLDELLALSDRLFVMSRGRIRETRPGERTAEALGLLMAGRWN